MTRSLVVIQARMGSSRLPGKVALPLAGAPLLVRMVERVRAASTPTEICVATSTLTEDDRVVELARQAGVGVHRGEPLDCLARHLGAGRAFGAEVVIKVPSDCPLVDPAAIDAVLGAYLRSPEPYDYVSNLHPPTWPDGNDVEVVPLELLALADREATRPLEREHTTPFFWERPARFRLHDVRLDGGRDLSKTRRFTVDYFDDYRFVAAVYDELHSDFSAAPFGLEEILGLLEGRPDLISLNARYAGVNWYRHHIGELATIGPEMTRTDVP